MIEIIIKIAIITKASPSTNANMPDPRYNSALLGSNEPTNNNAAEMMNPIGINAHHISGSPQNFEVIALS